MFGLTQLVLQASEETAPGVTVIQQTVTETVETVVTQYSDMKVPAFSMIALAGGALLLIVIGIIAFIQVKNRTFNWGPGVIAGLLFNVLFCYLAYTMVMSGISLIPGMKAMSEDPARADRYTFILSMTGTVFSFILEGVAAFFGVRYAFRMLDRRHLKTNIGAALAYGVSAYAAAIFLGQQITYSFQYLMIMSAVNQSGFDGTLTMMVQNGEDLEAATNALLSLTKTPGFVYLGEHAAYVLSALAQTAAAVLFYGVRGEKLEKKYTVAAFGVLIITAIPNLIGYTSAYLEFGIPSWILFVLSVLLTAGVVFYTVKVVAKYMPDDVKMLKSKHHDNRSGGLFGKKPEEPKKMPKIVMPD